MAPDTLKQRLTTGSAALSAPTAAHAMRILMPAVVPPWRVEETIADLRVLCRECGVTDFAFVMQCHPESAPLLTKIDEMVERFVITRDRLAADGLRCGILVQTLVDHTERGRPVSAAPYQRIVGADGTVCPPCFCPLDPGFLDYTAGVMTRLAQAVPAFILLDDDIRLESHPPAHWGCLCERHLALFAEQHGQAVERPAFLALMARDDATGLDARNAWQRTKAATYARFGGVVREAIDAVAPTIPCGICVVAAQCLEAVEFARAVAGDQRPMIRLGQATYLERGHKKFPRIMTRIANQRAAMPDDIDFLCEADTWPQTRYSLSATGLHGTIVGGLCAGVGMPKLWLSHLKEWRLAETDAYRRMIRTHRRFYDTLAEQIRRVRWEGPVALNTWREKVRRPWTPSDDEWLRAPAWGSEVCGRLGIPFRVRGAGVTMLEGTAPLGYERQELAAMLRGPLLLDGQAAAILTEMGFAEQLGLRAMPGDELRFSYERLLPPPADEDESAGSYLYSLRSDLSTVQRLVPTSNDVRVLSQFEEWPWFQAADRSVVAPSLTCFTNAAGGRIAVYAHHLRPLLEYSFMSDRRKTQLVDLLQWLGGERLPVVVESQVDTYVHCGVLADSCDRLIVIFNLNTDDIEPLTLTLREPPVGIRQLANDGNWRTVKWQRDPGTDRFHLDLTVRTMRPVVLILEGPA